MQLFYFMLLNNDVHSYISNSCDRKDPVICDDLFYFGVLVVTALFETTTSQPNLFGSAAGHSIDGFQRGELQLIDPETFCTAD